MADERALTELLRVRLPRYPAPPALKDRLAVQWSAARSARRTVSRRSRRAAAAALAASILLLIGIPTYYERVVIPKLTGTTRLVTEAVNDHLRILLRAHPLDVEGAAWGSLQAWFAGRLDFTPAVAFAGDQEFVLQGGAIGYFIDRKAATFVYKRRSQTVSLFVFRADGLAWPSDDLRPMGPVQTYMEVERGINVFMWQTAGLCYALVSDLDSQDLFRLGLMILEGN